ncbi:alpha/beta fold hydrolase [uncultured Oscillibacter sp.]|uniref:alpha/beta fold hydrolase n=1 Tax=uncultured Oscillibacter sp. TaxID=876091 RepID=UPI0028052D10|nr:alpha/beta fold hydrolase [uncultured Oscillibacter sp.]
MARERFGRLPLFLLGHSMGSFLARTYLIRYPGTVDGAILVGTGQMSPAVLAVGSALARAECRRLGETQISPLVERLAFGPYNKPFSPARTPYDWLSLDPSNVDAYLADPLCGGIPTVGLFRELLYGLRLIRDPQALRNMNLATPVLFLSGAMDPVGGCGRGVQAAFRSFRRAGVRDVSLRLYPQLRHEILNEASREDVYQDLCQWLECHLDA